MVIGAASFALCSVIAYLSLGRACSVGYCTGRSTYYFPKHAHCGGSGLVSYLFSRCQDTSVVFNPIFDLALDLEQKQSGNAVVGV